jgi:uncharacterized protein YfaQ (DUF2300 family)
METMPGHGVGVGFAGAVMAKQRKTIPARVKVARVIASVYIILSLPCGEQNRQNLARVKYWEIIADNLSKAGWSWGCVSAIDCDGRTIWIADAHRDNGKRFVVRADEKLTAFLELERITRAPHCLRKGGALPLRFSNRSGLT